MASRFWEYNTERGEIVLARDAKEGYYKTKRGATVRVVSKASKYFPPRPKKGAVPYKRKKKADFMIYGWLPEDYELILKEEQCY